MLMSVLYITLLQIIYVADKFIRYMDLVQEQREEQKYTVHRENKVNRYAKQKNR